MVVCFHQFKWHFNHSNFPFAYFETSHDGTCGAGNKYGQMWSHDVNQPPGSKQYLATNIPPIIIHISYNDMHPLSHWIAAKSIQRPIADRISFTSIDHIGETTNCRTAWISITYEYQLILMNVIGWRISGTSCVAKRPHKCQTYMATRALPKAALSTKPQSWSNYPYLSCSQNQIWGECCRAGGSVEGGGGGRGGDKGAREAEDT